MDLKFLWLVKEVFVGIPVSTTSNDRLELVP